MQTDYQHDFENVEDYLHHRPPYLLIDRVIAVDNDSVETEKLITGEEFFLPGHFPGAQSDAGVQYARSKVQPLRIGSAREGKPSQVSRFRKARGFASSEGCSSREIRFGV